MSRTCLWIASACALPMFGATAALAQPAGVDTSNPWVFGVQGGAIYQHEADIDGGGGFSVARGYVEPSMTYVLGPLGNAGVSLGYGYSDYDFSPGAFLGGQEPWGGVNDLRLSFPVRWAATDGLQVFAAPSLRFDWENGSDMADGMTGGAVIGASWRVSDSFSIGPGVGVFSGLEEDIDVFPILLINWQMTDDLALRTGSGLGASRGPGLTLDWQVTDEWSLGIGARYEKTRFRLDDIGPAPGGVGEDKAFPVFLTAGWEPIPNARLTAIAGIETGGELSLENSSGGSVASTDYDPAGFFGFAFRARF